MRCEPQAVLSNQDVESLAATVAEYGDEIENIILQERPQDINLLYVSIFIYIFKFLTTVKYFRFLRDKNSPAYTIFRQRVGYLKAKMIANKLTPTEIKPQTLNQILVTDLDSEDLTNKKRKRKSRWANENVKVPITSKISGIPSIVIGQTISQPVKTQQLGN